MRLQPRLQTLEIWRSVAQYCSGENGWVWGGRDDRNSISDAEQLLCLMYPAADVSNLSLDVPDATNEDVLDALKALGDGIEIPQILVDAITEYMASYSSDTGTPLFAGETYFQPSVHGVELSKEQRALDVVDSYAMSISLALSTLGFLKVFSRSVTRPQLKEKIAALEEATSKRLTAALVGLLRSFCVNVFSPDSQDGRILLRTLNQSGQPDRIVLEELRRALRPVRATLREVMLGQDEQLDNENLLFDCGWTWGVARGAPILDTDAEIGDQPEGVAEAKPYLYFTVVALDGIRDLFTERTRILGLLNAEQLRLAQILQLRWSITREYWSLIARFGEERWPLEDIPWRTGDGEESLYFSLLVSAVVLLDLLERRATDDDLTRTVAVLEEIAIRGRINRRFVNNDTSAVLHFPGVQFDLVGSEQLGPMMAWIVADFAALMLKRATRAAGLSRNSSARERLLIVADDALNHLWKRKIKTGRAAGLWDDPSPLLPGIEVDKDRPSWYLTERVVESLVIASTSFGERPIRSSRLLEVTMDLLSEADHLFSQEQLEAGEARGPAMRISLKRIETRLQRARRIVQERPATANALVVDVLRELDEFAEARRDAARSM